MVKDYSRIVILTGETLHNKVKNERFFVGRESEIERISKAFQRIQGGHAASFLVSGEAGTGKTTLLNRACEILTDQNAVFCAVGTCSLKLGQPEPYWPFREAFRSLVRQGIQRVHDDASNEQPLLSQLLLSSPELCTVMRPDLALGIDHFQELTAKLGLPPIPGINSLQQVSQEDIFTQYVRFVSYMSAHEPVIICIDNLHWTDDTSLDMFCYLGQNLPERVLLIGTYRSECLVGEHGNADLRQLFNELRRQGASHLTLDQRLENKLAIIEFTSKYLQSRFPQNAFPCTFSQSFAAHTGGNPLFMGELLAYAIQQGNIINDGQTWMVKPGWEVLDLPESLDAVVEERLQRLTEKLRETLACASVQGHDFTAEVLARVQNQDPDSVMECLLDDLGKSHKLVDERGEQEISPTTFLSLFQFRNNIIQQRLYKNLGVTQRRRMHKKVAECLEIIYGDNRHMIAPQLSFHYRMARDVDKALTYELEAAKQYARQIAIKEAISSFRSARDLALARAVQNDNMEQQITMDIADLLKKSGNLAEAISEYSKITSEYNSEPITMAWALNGIGDAYRMQGDMLQARPFYEKCESLPTFCHLSNQNFSLSGFYPGQFGTSVH